MHFTIKGYEGSPYPEDMPRHYDPRSYPPDPRYYHHPHADPYYPPPRGYHGYYEHSPPPHHARGRYYGGMGGLYSHEDDAGRYAPHDELGYHAAVTHDQASLDRLAEHQPVKDEGKSLKSGEATTAGGSKEGSLHAVSSSFSNERGEGAKGVVTGVGAKGVIAAAKSPGIVTHGSGSVGSTVDKGE